MRMVLLFLMGMIAGSAAWGAVYEWVDTGGVVHMTDDPTKVPDAYRKKMKTLEIDAGDSTPPAAVPSGRLPAASVPVVAEGVTYGGYGEKWWRSTFKEVRSGIANLQAQIESKKNSLEDLHRRRVLFQKPSDRVSYFQLDDEIAKDEERLKVLNDDLAQLTEEADGADVPLEWRE